MRDVLNNIVAIIMAILGIVILALLLNKSGQASQLISSGSSSFAGLIDAASNAGSGSSLSAPTIGGFAPFSGG